MITLKTLQNRMRHGYLGVRMDSIEQYLGFIKACYDLGVSWYSFTDFKGNPTFSLDRILYASTSYFEDSGDRTVTVMSIRGYDNLVLTRDTTSNVIHLKDLLEIPTPKSLRNL